MVTLYTLAHETVKTAQNPDLLQKARELFVGIAALYSGENVKKSELNILLFTIESFIKQGKVSEKIYENDLPVISKMMFDRVFQSELATRDIVHCILINLVMRQQGLKK